MTGMKFLNRERALSLDSGLLMGGGDGFFQVSGG